MSLAGKIAVVTGASRGIGRGIALQLGKAGATVYITGRKPSASLSSQDESLPKLEQTAKEVSERGGRGIPAFVDHSNMVEVKTFFEMIEKDNNGQLDILVNNAYSAVKLKACLLGAFSTFFQTISDNIGKKFYECPPEMWDEMNNVGLRNHYYCSVYGAKMMAKQKKGLIVNISSAGGLQYIFNVPYGVGKQALDRLSEDMALELKDKNVTVVSLWPAAVKTEISTKSYETTGKVMGSEDLASNFNEGESTEYAGKAVVALASDPKVINKTGKILLTADMGTEYGYKDIDGSDPMNIRCLQTALHHLGWKKTSRFIPKFIKVPGVVIWASTSRFYKSYIFF